MLAASLIVKNELGRYLRPCIAHLREFCDLIVVLDDDSTDGTDEWLSSEFDDQLIAYYIRGDDGFFAGHEGRRRQHLLELTLEQKPTWVLNIDADEFISDGAQIRAFCDQSQHPIGSLVMAEVWKATGDGLSIREDGGWRPHPIPCLWRTVLTGRRGQPLRIADRALACGREPEEVRRHAARARPTGATIFHFGWSRESEREGRYQRYVTADGGRFHQNAHLQSIMLPDMDVTMSDRKWPASLEPWRDQITAIAASDREPNQAKPSPAEPRHDMPVPAEPSQRDSTA